MERTDIEAKYKWDLSVIYADEDAFAADYKAAEDMIEAFAKHEGTMCRSGEALYAALRDMADMEYKVEKLLEYAYLGFAVDSTKSASQALWAKGRALLAKAVAATWFVSPYILKLDEETINSFFRECPSLETFRRRVYTIVRQKPYTLSDDGEQLISKLDENFGTHEEVRSIFENSDLRFGKIRGEDGKPVELTDATYVTFLMSGERRVRRAAFCELYRTYGQFANTLATLFNAMVRENCNLARVRGFRDSLTSSTFADEVTPEIYENLIASVNRGLPAIYDYWKLKARVLGMKRLHMYDVYTPLVGKFDRKYTYEEAVDEVLATTEVYGSEYSGALRAGLTEKGWVDVYPSRGKRGGAFSGGGPATEPYILLNFNGKYDDVSTLAHEAGHSMHSWYSRKYNEPHDSNYTIFVAEVASTVNELLLAHRKLRECTDNEEKLYILNQLLETYKGTLFRQTMFAEFERDIHAASEAGTPLTAESISACYYELVKKYFGPAVVCDKQIELEWARIPHFYSCFYVYKYATCISAATAIVKRIETEGEAYVGKYIEFLKCGGSKSPLDSLAVAGIDMRDPAVIDAAIDEFSSLVSEFANIYSETSGK